MRVSTITTLGTTMLTVGHKALTGEEEEAGAGAGAEVGVGVGAEVIGVL